MINKICRLSDEAIKFNVGQRKNDSRLGEITGESQDKRCWLVTWEGNKWPQSYWKGYITVIKACPFCKKAL